MYNEFESMVKGFKSDGGSSDYYQIKFPVDILLEAAQKAVEEGKSHAIIETEDIIRYALDNDFDRGNIFKCMVRITSLENGLGKAGNDALYDASKIVYSAEKMRRHYKEKAKHSESVHVDSVND